MHLTVDSTIQKYFQPTSLFEQIMQLQGDVFRDVAGRRTQRIILGEQSYFLKQHFGVGWHEIFKNLCQFRLPIIGAHSEKQALTLLHQIGIPTMHIAGYGWRGLNPARCQSFLITHELHNVISLEDFYRQNQVAISLKRQIIKEVARITRIMHQHGINHRDLYICHFLLDKSTQKSSPPKLYLIDLHRAQIRTSVPERWLIKDLASLYFSSMDIVLTRGDYLRFIREYRRQGLHHIVANETEFWQKVKTRGDKTYRRHGNKCP